MDEGGEVEAFWAALGGKGPIASADEGGPDDSHGADWEDALFESEFVAAAAHASKGHGRLLLARIGHVRFASQRQRLHPRGLR
jgi:hypothetical protein